jgi:hypothetical protein
LVAIERVNRALGARRSLKEKERSFPYGPLPIELVSTAIICLFVTALETI